jgi:PqqD family protein of HPr-rel-A system
MTRDLYRTDPPAARRVVALDDGLVLVFHRPSASTHVVASPVPEILAALAEGPATIDALMDRLSASFDLADAAPEALISHLDSLEAAGLVARA